MFKSLRLAYVLIGSVVYLFGCLGPQRAYADTGKKVFKNKASTNRLLKSVTFRNKDGGGTAEQIKNINKCVKAGKTVEVESSIHACPCLEKVTWCDKEGGSDKDTTQLFPSGETPDLFPYTLLISFDANIEYSYASIADLTNSIPVPENETINLVNGIDTSGFFSPGVEFTNLDTMLPYSGAMVSRGEIEVRPGPIPTVSTWSMASFGLLVVVAGTIVVRGRKVAAYY